MALPIHLVASFGPSVWNTGASRLAYIEEVNRRMLALDDVIRGGKKLGAGGALREQWAPFFRSWQVFLSNTLGGGSQSWIAQLKRKVNLTLPYSLVEAGERFDKQWADFARRAQKQGLKVPLPPGKELDKGMDWAGTAKAVAIVAVAGAAVVAMLRFSPKTTRRLRAARRGRQLRARARRRGPQAWQSRRLKD